MAKKSSFKEKVLLVLKAKPTDVIHFHAEEGNTYVQLPIKAKKYKGIPLEELKLSGKKKPQLRRAVDSLQERDIITLKDFYALSSLAIMSTVGFNYKSLEQINERLTELGYPRVFIFKQW